MLFLDGDTNLCGVYPELLQRLEVELNDKIGPNRFLNILVLLDRIPTHCPTGETTRYHIQPNAQYVQTVTRWEMGELNMGDPATLINFVEWAMNNYPADRYYLAIDDHGNGVSGISWDDSTRGTDNKSDKLTNAELFSALKTVTRNGARKFDILAYEACLMGLYEVAHDAAQVADILFFFPTINFTNRASYPAYLRDERFQPTTTGRAFGDVMFDLYYGAVTGKPYAMSLVDLAQIPTLDAAVNAWSNALRAALPTQRAAIAEARAEAQKVDSNADLQLTNDDVLIDLWDLADRLARKGIAVAEGNALKAAIDAAVVRKAQRSFGRLDYSNTHGLTIYWPQTASGLYTLYIDDQIFSVTRKSNWDEFLEAYFGRASGRASLPTDPGPVAREVGDGLIFLPIIAP
jgi:hypothetical protein